MGQLDRVNVVNRIYTSGGIHPGRCSGIVEGHYQAGLGYPGRDIRRTVFVGQVDPRIKGGSGRLTVEGCPHYGIAAARCRRIGIDR